MQKIDWQEIEKAKQAAISVLLHNAHGPFNGLPRTAGWGYPEPYTRDLMFSILGIAVSGNDELIISIRVVLETPILALRPNRAWPYSITGAWIMKTGAPAIPHRCFFWAPGFLESLPVRRIF